MVLESELNCGQNPLCSFETPLPPLAMSLYPDPEPHVCLGLIYLLFICNVWNPTSVCICVSVCLYLRFILKPGADI